jgi:hypothetical protein
MNSKLGRRRSSSTPGRSINVSGAPRSAPSLYSSQAGEKWNANPGRGSALNFIVGIPVDGELLPAPAVYGRGRRSVLGARFT